MQHESPARRGDSLEQEVFAEGSRLLASSDIEDTRREADWSRAKDEARPITGGWLYAGSDNDELPIAPFPEI